MATPTITDTLAELLERVRKAEAPDRALDARLGAVSFYREPLTEDEISLVVAGRGNIPPTYTSSLDACLSLLGEVLPGHIRNVYQELDRSFRVSINDGHIQAIADNRSEPLALLDCILQALLNQEAIKEKTDV